MQRVRVGRRRAADLPIQEAPPGLWDAGPWGQEGKWLEASGYGLGPRPTQAQTKKLWLRGQERTEGQTDRWLSGLSSSRRPHTMSIRVCPRLGVGLWLWLGVTLGLGQGQGEDTGVGFLWPLPAPHPRPYLPRAQVSQGTSLPLALSPQQLLFWGDRCSGGRDGKRGQLCPRVALSCGLTIWPCGLSISLGFFRFPVVVVWVFFNSY